MAQILIADDHPMCSAALAMAARAVDAEATVTTVTTLKEAEMAAEEHRFDLVLLDVMLPDVQGLAGLALLRSILPAATIAIVSGREEPSLIRQAAGLGASGFIAKSSPMDRMISAIRVLREGGQWFPGGVATGPIDDDLTQRIASLSTAQLRVLRAMARGGPNRQIADELQIAEPTVKSHLSAIFRKLGVPNRTSALLALQTLEDAGGPAVPG